MWIKPGNLRIGWNILASRWFANSSRAGADTDWHFGIYGTTTSNLKLRLDTASNNPGGGLSSTLAFPSVAANKWYHVGFTIDPANNNTATLFINGVADGSATGVTHTDSATAQLHVGDVGESTSFAGLISRVRIYGAALTASQMIQNFNNDATAYGIAPANPSAPTISGTPRVGTALTANVGTWTGDLGATTTYKWQTSTDGATWTDISGATATTYTPVAADATNYLRVIITKTTSAGTASGTSAATAKVQTASGASIISGGKLTGLTSTVPNDAGLYNVTLATNNLSATMTLGTTTGLTVIPGYASTASYMASTISAAAPIISFRGTGTAINTALANVTYTSAAKQVDVVKLYYATASATASDTKNYIPIYDNGQLTFHYYTYKWHTSTKDRAGMDAALVGLTTTDDVEAPGPWYLVTPRYQVEWERIKLINGQNPSYMGAKADANSANWYWPANTDGYSTATIFGTQSGSTVTATSTIYNGTNTALPFHSGEPNSGTSIGRSGYFYISNSTLGWDDVPLTTSVTNFTMETYGTAPFNATASGSLAQTVSVVANSFDAPTGLTVEATGTTGLAVSWNSVASNLTGITLANYRVEYSTSSSFATLSYVLGQPSPTAALIPGLTANTTYYVRVLGVSATGGVPWGAYSSVVTVTTKSAATTINVVATGGGVAGTDYTLSGGQFYAKSGTSVNINASEIQTALNTGNAVLAADVVNINAPITWASSRYLTLGTSATSTVSINKSITASVNGAQLLISPTSYNLDVKNGASIQFTGAGTQYLNIGGVAYTLIKTEAQLVAATAATNYALAKPLALATTYTTSPMALSYTGKFDGLGNTLDGLKLNAASALGSYGLIQNLSGGTVRNLGVTNVRINIPSYNSNYLVGALAGETNGATIDQVWTTGFINTAVGGTINAVAVGGLIGNAKSGITTITKSWSSVNIDTANSTSIPYHAAGALVGTDVSVLGQQSNGAGGTITMNQVYSTGGIRTLGSSTWWGKGGLLGLHYSTAWITITDAFYWGNFVTSDTAGIGGIIGVSSGGTTTVTNAYTVYPTSTWVSSGAFTATNVQNGQTAGAPVTQQTGANWVTDSTNGTYLVNLAKPYKNIYYQVVAPTDASYQTIRTQLVDGASQVQDLDSLNLATSGTSVYSVTSSVARGTYDVSYVSGLTLGGSASGLYNVSIWPFTTSVTISRLLQTVTWSPSTSIAFGTGSFTPSASATSSVGATISYAVTSPGTTGCSVNSSTGVVTYTASGNCQVTATAAQTTDYASAAKTVTYVIGEAAAAPTVTAVAANTTSVALSWTTPTVNANTSLTGYQITYSTSSSMTSPTTITTGNTSTSKVVDGLTAGTTYYFQVRAVNGSTWSGSANATPVSAAPKSTSTTFNIVASGGGTLGADYKISNGVVYSSSSSVNINVADLQAELFTGNVTLAADTINVNTDLTWASNQTLTLGYLSSNSVNVNAVITVSGASGGLVIVPSTYALDVKSSDEIVLSGASTSLSIGGNAYTLIRNEAGLASVGTTGFYALAKPLTLTTAYTASPINQTFTGTLDGLGNTIDRLAMTTSTTSGSYGFIKTLGGGAAVRNLGLTNLNLRLSSSTGLIGGLAGSTTGATIAQVWTTGFIRTVNSMTSVALGGIVGNATSGSLSISKSWSSVNIDSSSTGTGVSIEQGGIVGGDESVVGQPSGNAGGVISLSQVYSTGTLKWVSTTHRGIGGLVGLHYNSTAGTMTITDSFSWASFTVGSPTGNRGGLVGVADGASTTITNSYQTTDTYCYGGLVGSMTSPVCPATKVTTGATVTGLTGSNWSSSGASTLVNLASPRKPLFVQILANTDGSYGTISHQIVDAQGTVQTSANLTTLGLSVSGTAVYSITSSAAISATPYSVYYVSGLALGGSNASMYELQPWRDTTTVTISKLAQSISFTSTAPTTAKVGTTYTPAATSTSGGAVTFTIDSGSASVCSISAGVITFSALGNCVINANQAGSASYLAAPQVQQTAVATLKGDQTITFTSSTPTSAKVAGVTYAPAGTSTSGGTPAFTIAAAAASICSISGGVVSFIGVGNCIVNADQAGNSNWNAATQSSQTFSVSKGVQAITFSSTAPTDAVVNGATYTVTATKTAGTSNSVAFTIDSTTTSICTIASGVVSFTAVGSCKVNANLDGDSKYEAASQIQQTIAVAKGAQVLTFTSNAPNGARVGAPDYTVTATGGASTSPIVLSVDASSTSKCSVSGLVVTYLAVGDCVLNLNQTSDSNFNAATQVQQTVTITSDGRCPNGVVSGNYCLMRFNSSGTWTVPAGVTAIDLLVVGGGGAGGGGAAGNISGGGGGGGEVIEVLGRVVSPGTVLTSTVGSGGIGGGQLQAATASTAGSGSSVSGNGFETITSRGGGQGATYNTVNSTHVPAGTGPTVAGGGGSFAQTPIRGNSPVNGGVSNGGLGYHHASDAALQAGGGGGGAGGNGGAGAASTPGNGGAGKSSTILGTTLGGGGGGGKRYVGVSGGTATAGGGAGGLGVAGTAGTANTGGGGGGSGGTNAGANGGSGVVVIRVALQSQTVSFTSTAPTGLIYGTSSTYTPTVSGTASEVTPTITVDAASSSVCSITSGVVSIISAGTCTLNANQAGNGFFSPATQVQQSFTVSKQTQSISFTSTVPTNAKVSGSSYTPTATGGGSGNAVTFTVTGSCSIAGGVVSFTSVGTCTVKADQAGGANHTAAPQVTQAITVAKGVQVISFTSTAPVNAAVDGATYTVTATGGASGSAVTFSLDSASSAVCSISGAVISFTAAGACVVKANQAGSANYEAASEVTQTITVGKGTQIIQITSTAPTNAVVDGDTYTITKTGGASGNPVVLTLTPESAGICSISGNVVSFEAVGDCAIKANQFGNDNYTAAPEVTQTITVGKGSQVISWTSTIPSSAVVGGSVYTPTATGGASVSSVEYSIASASAAICNIQNGDVVFTAVGSCVVEANQAGDDNYVAATQVTQTITVGKGSQTVAFTTTTPSGVHVAGSTYTPAGVGGNGSAAVVIEIASSAATICSMTNGEVSWLAAGSCVIEISQAGDANYNAATTQTQTIQVAKGYQVLSWTVSAPNSAVVDGETFTPAATGGASGENVVYSIDSTSSAVCTLANGDVSFHGAGECVVHANQAGNDNWEAAPEISMIIQVGKGSQEITWDTTAPTNAVVAGSTYTPAATGGATGHAVSFRINLNAASVCSITSGVIRFIGVGTCLVEGNQNGDSNYESAPTVTQSFAVGKGTQVILFTSTAPTDAVVGGAKYTPTALGGNTGNTVTFSIANGSSSVCSLTAGKVSFLTPGDCVINANQAGNTNFNAANTAAQTVTVAKGAQAIAFTSTFTGAKVGGTTYAPVANGGPSGQAVTFTIDSSASNICSITSGVVSFTAVGNCVINANQAGNSTYNAAPQVQQTIAVTKGTQVVTFTSDPPHNAQVQGLTYVPTATGSASGIDVVFTVPAAAQMYCTISNGVVSFHAVGNCVLYADQPGNTNWNAATRISQIFDVTKGQQTVTITSTAPTNAKVDGASYTITSSSTGGSNAVSYSISELSTDICTVTGASVSFRAAGDCVVVASKNGDSQFNPANPVTQTFSVGKGAQVLAFIGTPASPKVDDNGYTPSVTDGAGTQAVRLSTADAIACEVVGTKVIFHKATDCTVYADQSGDANYEAAAQVVQTLSVAKGNQAALVSHASLDNLTLGDGNSPSTVIAVSGGSGTGAYGWAVNADSANICTLADDVITGIAVGVCQIDIQRVGDDNYLDAVDTMTVNVSSGNQAPVSVTVSDNTPTYAPGLYLTMSLLGGAGEGAVWYETLTPHICNTDGDSVLNILHAGTCTIVGHKDGTDTYLGTQDDLTFQIAKATMAGVSVAVAHAMFYSSTSPAEETIVLGGILSDGERTLSVTEGDCEIADDKLVAYSAGSCVVRLVVDADENYETFTTDTTFTIGKSDQSNLTAARQNDQPAQITFAGVNTTAWDISGGSGNGALSVSVTNSQICSAAIADAVVTVTGMAAGDCEVTVAKAGDDNFNAASTTFSVAVVRLPAGPASVSIANTGTVVDGDMQVTVSWTAATQAAGTAAVSGFELQRLIGTTWTTVTGGIVSASTTSLTVGVPTWTKIQLRVAAISELDPSDITARDWTNFTGTSGGDAPVDFPVPGALQLISTNIAAVTSGEVVTLTGTGFAEGVTTRVQLSTAAPVFSAGIGIRATTANTVTLPATVISDTKLSFILPKITLPKGTLSLATSVKVLSTDGIQSQPVPFNYIPKKLSQVLTIAGLPATKSRLSIASGEVTGTATATSGLALVTATPASVCTATIESGALSVTPVGRGTCSVVVSAPTTPGYTAAASKSYSYSITGASQTIAFTNPGNKTWSAEPFTLDAVATLTPVFTSKTPTVCTVASNQLTMLKAGTCTVTASQPGSATIEPATAIGNATQSFTIAKATRTAGLTATVRDVLGGVGEVEHELNMVNTTIGLTSANVSIYLGENPVDVPIRLNRAEGTIALTVDKADAARCTAEPGTDDPTLAFITVNDLGSCKVTITLPADDRWNASGERIVVWVNAASAPSGVDPAPTGFGDGQEAPSIYYDNTSTDPDSDPAVLLSQTGDSVTAALGGDLGMTYDAVTGKYSFRSKTLLVGSYKATMTGPAGTNWFVKNSTVTQCTKYSKGKCVKSINVPVTLAVNECITTLTVKKDPKLKKRVLRIIGPGCQLNDAGKAAFQQQGVQNIVMKYLWIRQYPSTGLAYVKKGSAKIRYLKKVKRTIVLSVGRPGV
jgi:hypothetical protein